MNQRDVRARTVQRFSRAKNAELQVLPIKRRFVLQRKIDFFIDNTIHGILPRPEVLIPEYASFCQVSFLVNLCLNCVTLNDSRQQYWKIDDFRYTLGL